MNHMNVMWYVGKFDEATWQLLSLAGITGAWLRQNNRGMVAVDQRTSYKRELVAGDLITVRSGILEVRPKVVRFFHEMSNDGTGEVAAVTMLTGVQIDTVTRKSCPLPDDIQLRAQSLLTAKDLGF
jgi:acyl-CoA thioester hydrolase